MQVQPGHLQPMMISAAEAVVELLVPDAVLRLLAAGISFLAVTVPEPRIDAERDRMSRRQRAELIDHVGRAAIDVQPQLHNEFERGAVENVGRVHDRWRLTNGQVSGR